MVNTGCPECDRNFIVNGDYCPKHKLEYLKWIAESAQKDYEEARNHLTRTRKETK